MGFICYGQVLTGLQASKFFLTELNSKLKNYTCLKLNCLILEVSILF